MPPLKDKEGSECRVRIQKEGVGWGGEEKKGSVDKWEDVSEEERQTEAERERERERDEMRW